MGSCRVCQLPNHTLPVQKVSKAVFQYLVLILSPLADNLLFSPWKSMQHMIVDLRAACIGSSHTIDQAATPGS